jgi:tetratricopeptide (TPR) repeat protein
MTDAAFDFRPAGSSLIDRVLGSSRALLGDALFIHADECFHRGVPHTAAGAWGGVFARWREAVAPTRHEELGASDIGELMPWFRMATRADPGNVDAYCVAAYWLLRYGRSREAERVLTEAMEENPGDYRVFQERSRVFLRQENLAAAARALDSGIRLWPGGLRASDDQQRLNLAWMLRLRAALYEAEGATAAAAEALSRIAAMFPEWRSVAEAVSRLRQGQSDPLRARRQLKDIFADHRMCSRGSEHEHEHEHESEAGHGGAK